MPQIIAIYLLILANAATGDPGRLQELTTPT